ncbi:MULTISPECIES: DUF3991 domain-containing protein [Caproicibacterium]|jgi:hypothetical protein|uniref:DUF3991 domain-containing protein n=1 Tax=Caproicibacterium TaxID=2834348 RepID=UPI000A28E550|nr:DUF3991 domain-containing protein [Caproicibacterium lactatifermentans]ARP50675.1 hypothetical protein B6259_07190 [Ruminococcaceae bacterium CPB6]
MAEMLPTMEILENIRKNSSKNKDEVFTRLYRYMLRKDLYYAAYKNLYANNGASTQGVDSDTADGFGEEKIQNIIQSLANETYQPNAGSDTHIRKFLKQFGVSDHVITRCIKENRLYEDKVHHAIFIQHDLNGNTVAAKKYSTLSGYTGWVKNSDESAGWMVKNDAHTLFVTNTPVTAMRAMSQYEKMAKNADFLAVGKPGENEPADSISRQESKIVNVIMGSPEIQEVEIESSMPNSQGLVDSIRKSFPEKDCHVITLKPVQKSAEKENIQPGNNLLIQADSLSPSL